MKTKKMFLSLIVLSVFIFLLDIVFVVVYSLNATKAAAGEIFFDLGTFAVTTAILNGVLLLYTGIYIFLRRRNGKAA